MDINPYASVNSIIVGAISPLYPKDAEGNYPVAHDVYTGSAKKYVLFSAYNRLPEQLASGMNHTIGVYGDIDVFSDADISGSSSIIKTIATALNAAKVIVKDIRDVTFDGVSHHVLIEFYISKARL